MSENSIEEGDKAQVKGLVFELETLAANGRKVLFDVMKSVLADKDAELTQSLFAKHCLSSGSSEYLPELLEELGKGRVSVEKLDDEINQGVNMSLDDSGVKVSKGMTAIVGKCAGEGFQLGALTVAGEEVAGRLADKLKAGSDIEIYSCRNGESVCPTADAWLKLVKAMDISCGGCTAIVTSGSSCRAALSAGMRVVAMPDEFTSFEDFGGADLVIDSYDDSVPAAVLEIANLDE